MLKAVEWFSERWREQPRVCMRTHSTAVCSKAAVVGLVSNGFVFKLIVIVVSTIYTEARLVILKSKLVYSRIKRFLHFKVTLRSCGLRYPKSNWIMLFLSV